MSKLALILMVGMLTTPAIAADYDDCFTVPITHLDLERTALEPIDPGIMIYLPCQTDDGAAAKWVWLQRDD
ncbi:hypothetical protein [Phyllobacterium lublinensis]|uniref:hypothetical protein n=1 Tax=Phyllobacterium lublinensis TaxID=2875708 RepID=UPI001CCFD53F|nr:hypothetical protein [Phyllobacterium sp. 2063]MBZ9654671.1 hypothetical protein [Phyllobacterium sp. 2063]